MHTTYTLDRRGSKFQTWKFLNAKFTSWRLYLGVSHTIMVDQDLVATDILEGKRWRDYWLVVLFTGNIG